MGNFSRISFALGWLLLAAPMLRAGNANQAFAPVSDVSFTISVDNTNAAWQGIVVKYEIKNLSKGPIYVPRMPSVNPCLIVGPVHIEVWLEDGKGKQFGRGSISSCLEGRTRTIAERLSKTAILIQAGENTDGTIRFDPELLKLPPGQYRVEAVLSGWREDEFSKAELDSLARWDAPFLSGESSAAGRVTLKPE